MSTEALKNLLKYESKLSDDNYDDISELVEKVIYFKRLKHYNFY